MRKILLLVAALSFAPAAFSTSLTKEEIAEYNEMRNMWENPPFM